MKVLDPGHMYLLDEFDGPGVQVLRFVKRCDPPVEYPGNTGSYPGTLTQEVLRALIDRAEYVERQKHCEENVEVIDMLRRCIFLLELRAARARGVEVEWQLGRDASSNASIELEQTCIVCGHVACCRHDPVKAED